MKFKKYQLKVISSLSSDLAIFYLVTIPVAGNIPTLTRNVILVIVFIIISLRCERVLENNDRSK